MAEFVPDMPEKTREIQQLEIISEAQGITNKLLSDLLKENNEINSQIHSRLGWIAFWLFLLVCGVGQSVVLF